MVVTDVDPNGVAAEHGFQTGDVILDVAGKIGREPADVRRQIARRRKEGKHTVLFRVKSSDRHTLRRASARQCLTEWGVSAGIRRPRRRCEPGGGPQGPSPAVTGSAPASVAPAGVELVEGAAG